ncbi:hypothetical protein I8751_19320 [Nostocaceae cyanobacterium CENA357]|uniref:Uncharacterized protein n=1 Tax=Atlanticothrix silvestris CENA357 TaxID=1725252 RepID=A0A8J7HGZ7_9CYAN|nr:hypothetical protein [Atlanticothrix silvestris CENA357]
MLNIIPKKGKKFFTQAASTTQEKASEITEEAIFTAVDQAINVIEIASKRVRQRDIPTEKVTLEVSVKIVGLIELRMRADVANTEEAKEVILDVTHNPHL